ncbi:MAG TPA: AAA family ATPase [Leptospiraceae bacterium]|nr:AAA family ATPase [Leptospiraceae bacterium]
MKHLPIGIQTFSKIIEGDFLYIDKTEIIYNLISDAAGAYFLSRPRRFGKSLLISTLEEIFLGNRELFKGLWIYDSDWRWHKYPVIRLDFSKQMAGTAEKLEVFLKEQMDYIASAHGFSLTKSETYSRFEELITVQTVFYLIFSLIGMKIKTEVKTNIGRIDAVIDDNHTYIFEFKLNGTKAQALQQIKDRKYHEKYTNKGKSVYLIGVEFQNRNIGEYVYEIIPR